MLPLLLRLVLGVCMLIRLLSKSEGTEMGMRGPSSRRNIRVQDMDMIGVCFKAASMTTRMFRCSVMR